MDKSRKKPEMIIARSKACPLRFTLASGTSCREKSSLTSFFKKCKLSVTGDETVLTDLFVDLVVIIYELLYDYILQFAFLWGMS